MKSTTSMPAKSDRGVCVTCHASLPIAFLRVAGISAAGEELRMCLNQAACRKRQRQLQAKSSTTKAP